MNKICEYRCQLKIKVFYNCHMCASNEWLGFSAMFKWKTIFIIDVANIFSICLSYYKWLFSIYYMDQALTLHIYVKVMLC